MAPGLFFGYLGQTAGPAKCYIMVPDNPKIGHTKPNPLMRTDPILPC